MENNDMNNIKQIGRIPISNEAFYILEFDDDPEIPNYDKEVLFARYNDVFKCFYDYRNRSLGSITFPNPSDINKFQVGLLVNYKEENLERPEIVVSDEVNKEIVEKYRIDYRELSKKYGNVRFDDKCNLFDTINSYCENRISNGLDVDPYIADIVYIIGNAMGLKMRGNEFLGENLGFSYPEEMQRAVSGLYTLVNLKVNGVESFKEPMAFSFNEDGVISEVYDTFRKQLEYVCGISHEGIYSDIYNRLRSNPNLPLEEKEDLKRQRPVISIHEDETLFYEDYAANHMPSIVLERGKSKYNWDFLNKQKPTEILM